MRKASTFYTGYQCVPVTHVISSLLHRSSRIANRLSLTTSELVPMRHPHLDLRHDEWRLRGFRASLSEEGLVTPGWWLRRRPHFCCFSRRNYIEPFHIKLYTVVH